MASCLSPKPCRFILLLPAPRIWRSPLCHSSCAPLVLCSPCTAAPRRLPCLCVLWTLPRRPLSTYLTLSSLSSQPLLLSSLSACASRFLLAAPPPCLASSAWARWAINPLPRPGLLTWGPLSTGVRSVAWCTPVSDVPGRVTGERADSFPPASAAPSCPSLERHLPSAPPLVPSGSHICRILCRLRSIRHSLCSSHSLSSTSLAPSECRCRQSGYVRTSISVICELYLINAP